MQEIENAILKETRRLWLQKYPRRSIALSSITDIITNAKKSPSYQQNADNNGDNLGNVPDNTVRLRKVCKAAAKLASEPNYKFICYNCGRLIPQDGKSNNYFSIGQESLASPLF